MAELLTGITQTIVESSVNEIPDTDEKTIDRLRGSWIEDKPRGNLC